MEIQDTELKRGGTGMKDKDTMYMALKKDVLDRRIIAIYYRAIKYEKSLFEIDGKIQKLVIKDPSFLFANDHVSNDEERLKWIMKKANSLRALINSWKMVAWALHAVNANFIDPPLNEINKKIDLFNNFKGRLFDTIHK
jgi:hypothetical protein